MQHTNDDVEDQVLILALDWNKIPNYILIQKNQRPKRSWATLP